MSTSGERKNVAVNRKARHNYFIEETLEAGLRLFGTEVKSLRLGKASIAEAYVGIKGGELCLLNAQIDEYSQAGRFFQHEPKRFRPLLVHAKERSRLMGLIKREGASLIPLAIYFNPRGLAKLEVGIAKGKRMADKRETEKKRDWERQKSRLLRNRG
ncbi:MAG TPA: SsrA-binding protein [Rhodospirillaceae bacterium]|nr:MAG: SsrA-binding protein [Alphaproteobacteria bacterium GWF2_58_20]HAU29612.1 SsrA-binding protein [Rhodospirillaceae bacterium]